MIAEIKTACVLILLSIVAFFLLSHCGKPEIECWDAVNFCWVET